jgi:hypothetical protein
MCAPKIAPQRVDWAAELPLLEGVDALCANVQEAMEDPTLEVQ